MNRDVDPSWSIDPTWSNREIVSIALDVEDDRERQALIDEACGGDATRRRQIEALLTAHRDRAPDPLDREMAETGLAETRGADADRSSDFDVTGDSRVGRYELLEQIGEGGMGIVFMARQNRPIRRRVALKLIKAGMDSRDVISRFQAERQTLAMMDHPNIASVLDAGTTADGRPYFAMELVDGIPITDFSDQEKLSVDDRLRLFVDVCRAVQHAHQKGIIHRDLKPSNVMVTVSDGVPVVKVIDFGVAKALNQELSERTLFTQFAQLIGTPMYMSPEQAEMSGSDIDTRSDIYSLGVLLYELLTGRPPFDRETLAKAGFNGMRRIICTREPSRPSHRIATSEAQPELSRSRLRELDSISMKALEKDRNRRYESASAFANDIQRYLNDEPVRACPPSVRYRIRKAAARHVGALIAALAIAAVLLVGTTASVWQAIRASRASRLAERQTEVARSERDRAARASEQAQTLLYTSDMKLASDAFANQDLPRAAELLDRHIPDEAERDLRGFEWYYFQKRVAGPNRTTLAHDDWVHNVAFSPDGKWLATTAARGRVRVYETATWQVGRTWVTDTETVIGLNWSHDGNRLAAACSDGGVRVWEMTTGEQRIEISAHRGAANDVAFAIDDRSLYSGGDDHLVHAWDIDSGHRQRSFTGHTGVVERIALSPDGKTLATASSDKTFAIWDAESARQLRSIGGGGSRVVCVAFSHDGKWIAAGNIRGDLYLADRKTLGNTRLAQQLDGIEALAFMPAGQWLATADRGGAIQLHAVPASLDESPLTSGTSPRWMAHEGRAISIATGPDGTRISSGGRDGRLRIWEPDLEASEWSMDGLASGDFATSPNGQLFVVGNDVRRRDLDRRCLIGSFGQTDSPWLLAACSADSRWLAVAKKGKVAVFDLASDRLYRSWPLGGRVEPHRIAISPDASYVALADYDVRDAISVYALDGEQPPRRLPAMQCECLAFSPDGERLAAGHRNDLHLYDLRTADGPRVLSGHSDTLADVAYSPDGETLATVSHDRLLKIWDSTSGEERFSVVAHRSRIGSVDFSPDGQTIATAEARGAVKLWHAATGQPLGAVTTETSSNRKIRFSSDGRKLAHRLADGRIVVYDATEPAN